MGHLNIITFGTFQASMDDHSLTAFHTDKARALLAYLAVESGRSHRRDALADMFWGDRPNSAARNNLRQALFNLREVLREGDTGSSHLLITPKDIQFDPAGDSRLDVSEFSAHLAVPQAHHPGRLTFCENCLEHLRAAIALYAGDFLAGFSLPGCPRFEWWLLSQQEFYHRQTLETLECLANYYESCRDYRQAGSLALKVIELEPWRESAYRRLMRSLALNGERSQALRQYQNCRAVLMDEMGIEPSRETKDLFEAIRVGAASVDLTQPQPGFSFLSQSSVSVSARQSTSFVGFWSELAQLDRYLATALAGHARVAFISGEAGSGKTTLLAEFIRRSLGMYGDLLVVAGGCNAQFGHGDPYLPFRQALHALTGDLEGIQSAGIPDEDHARRIWSALPFVLEVLLSEGPNLVGAFLPLEALSRGTHRLGAGGADALAKFEAQAAGPQPGQLALFDEFTRVLLAISRRYPLILALDDLQWADQGSLSLLFHLARNLGESRVLLVGSYRPEEIALERNRVRHPMQTLVNELLAQYGEMRIDLSSAYGWDFVNALLDSEPNELGATFRRALFQLTEGHPLFTVEGLRVMQESGGLVQDETGRWVVGEELDWERIPARAEAVIAERLARLSADCRALLDAASVQGVIFSAEKLAVVLGESEARMIELLSGELSSRHRLVFAEGVERIGETTRSHYRFRHALYQRQLYQNLDPVLRARLHQVTGEFLERRFTQQTEYLPFTDDNPSRLAFHFEKAGLLSKAIHYHQKTGEQAYRLAANEDAIYHYERALELLKSVPESREIDRQELLILIALSAALNAARGYAAPELRRLFTRAGILAREIGEIDLASQALYFKGAYHHARAEYWQTLETGEGLLKLSPDKSIPRVSDTANLLLGIGRLNMGDFSLAQAFLQKIEAEVHSDRVNYTKSSADRARLLYPAFLAWVLWFLGYPDQALHMNKQLLAKVRLLDYPYILGFTLGTSACVIHALRGDVEQLQECAQELTALATEKGFYFYRAWGMIFLGRAQVAKGDVEPGLINLQAGLEAFRATGHLDCLTFMLAMQAEAFATAGQDNKGLEVLSEAISLAKENGEHLYEAELYRLRGELLIDAFGAEGEAEAETCFQKALTIARQQKAKSMELRAATSLAKLWAHQHKASQARQMLREVYDWFSEGFDTPDLQKSARLLASIEKDIEHS